MTDNESMSEDKVKLFSWNELREHIASNVVNNNGQIGFNLVYKEERPGKISVKLIDEALMIDQMSLTTKEMITRAT